MKLFTNGASCRAVAVLVVALLALTAACAPSVPQDKDVVRSSVVFDSTNGVIPLPSDLALEADGTLPNQTPTLPQDQQQSAQADFYNYLDTLHGWLPSTPLTIPVDGPVDPASLSPDVVKVFKFTDSGYEVVEVSDVSFDAANNQIVVTPAQPLALGTQYGYVLTQGVKDPDGNPFVAPQTLFFALSSEPLVDDQGNITNDLLAQAATKEEAQQLEQVRQLMAPVVDAAVAEGIDRSQIIAVTAWHTATDAFTVFDPTAGQVPFPNEFVRTQDDDPNVDLPVPANADQLTQLVINTLNQRDGFSVTADGWIPVEGAPLDPSTVTTDTIPVAWTEGTSVNVYPADRYQVTYQQDMSIIDYGPINKPFEQDKLSAGLVSTGVKDVNGNDIKPTPAFVFLRSKFPIYKDGHSTVDVLDDATAQQLEAARQAYNQLFLAAVFLGFTDRSQIANAWAFTTDESTLYQQQLSAKAETLANANGSPSAQGDPTTVQTSPSGMPDVGMLQEAAYTTEFFLNPSDPHTLLDTPTEQPVPITIAVPDSSGDCGAGPYPIVIMGHGLGGKRQDMIGAFSDILAASPYCMASVALDFPLHGERTPSGNTSGQNFLSADAPATMNNFLQAAADLSVLTEVIKDNGLEGVLDADNTTDFIDESKIGYVGVSLGSLIGTNFVTTDADVTVAALNVGGGKLTDIVLNGSIGQDILTQLPDSLQPGTFQFFQTFAFLQWIVEPVDPWTFGPHVQTDPLASVTYDAGADSYSTGEALPANAVMLQMAGQDQVIPNSATERLAASIGVSLDDTTFPNAEHGFVFGTGDAADCARQQVAQWISSGLSGDAALTSAEQNACGLGGQ